jgi:hypothetical protein
MWGGVSGERTPKEEQNLFCDLCGGVGENLRRSKVAESRVGKLRAAGNAIVPALAAEFIRAYLG